MIYNDNIYNDGTNIRAMVEAHAVAGEGQRDRTHETHTTATRGIRHEFGQWFMVFYDVSSDP